MASLVKHPFNHEVINLDKFATIKLCTEHQTHVNFYENPQAEGVRGNPSYIIYFPSKELRERWFTALFDTAVGPNSTEGKVGRIRKGA